MNCPNCGAPIKGKTCEYCGTHHAKKSEKARIEIKREYTDIVSWDGMEVFRVYHEPEVKVAAELWNRGLLTPGELRRWDE